MPVSAPDAISGLISAGVVGVAAGLVAAAICRPVLTRLAEPTEELQAEAAEQAAAEEADKRGERFRRTLPQVDAPKIPYKDLPTRRFVAATGLLGLVFGGAAGVRLGWSPETVGWGIFAVAAALLFTIDLRTYMLPAVIVWSAEAAILVTWVVTAIVRGDYSALWRSLLCGVGTWLVLWLLWLIMPGGVGGGDVRLAGLNGLALGWLGLQPTWTGLAIGFFAGAIGGGILVAAKVFSRKGFPYGPFLLLGAFAAMVLSGYVEPGI